MSPTAQEATEEIAENRPIPESKKWFAEAIGTFSLVLGGAGTAVLAGQRVGVLGVALAFGSSLAFLMYALGPISGCHVNPAVTVGHVMVKRLSVKDAVGYIVAQVVGGLIAGLVLFALARNISSYDRAVDGLAAQGWGVHSPSSRTGPLGETVLNEGYGMAAMIIVEVLFTALLVFVVLATTDKLSTVPLAGVSVGLTLAVAHLVALPVDGASINPARSIAVAPYQHGAMGQLWAFIVFPLIGGVLGALVYGLLYGRSRDLRS